jgi:hypothetical protein
MRGRDERYLTFLVRSKGIHLRCAGEDEIICKLFLFNKFGGGGVVDWIHLAQRRDQRRAVVNTVTKISVAIEVICILC